MGVNQVYFGDEKIMDITDSTVEPEDVLLGSVFYAADGERKTGLAARITIDDELSETSENPVQNKVIKGEIDRLDTKIDNKTVDVDDELDLTSENPVQNKVIAESLAEEKNARFDMFPTESASGSIASFDDGADDVPVKSLVVNIAPAQSGSGDPAPDNVRPIFGWEAVSVSAANANLIAEYSEHPLAMSGDEYIYYYTAGTSVLFRCKEGVSYYLLRGEGATRNVWAFYREKPVPGRAGVGSVSEAHATNPVGPVVAPLTGWCVIFIRQSEYNEDIAKGTQVSLFPPTDVSLPDTTGVTVDLGQTVYGGTLDVVTGALTVDKVVRSVSALNRTNDHNFYIGTSAWEHRPLQHLHTVDELICDRLPTIPTPASVSAAVDGCYTDSARAFIVRTAEAYTTAADMITALGGQINICYKTEPFVVAQLTPTEVTTLLGLNNIWADTGDVDVTYRADVQLYINEKTAQTLTAAASMLSNVETSMTATRAYAVNDFLSVNGQLYRVTAAIANGATITPGTNVVESTIGEQITALLNS